MKRCTSVLCLGALLLFPSCDSAGQQMAAEGGATGSGGMLGSNAASDGGGGRNGDGGSGGSELQTIIDAYPNWQPRTATPVNISAGIFALCRLPTAAELAFTQSAHGPFAVRDWTNPAATAAIAARAVDGFPAGAAIVKEKFSTAATGTLELAALGIMIKRAPGSRPQSGDWEFGYWSSASGLSVDGGALAACASCHHDAAGARDSVFIDDSWR